MKGYIKFSLFLLTTLLLAVPEQARSATAIPTGAIIFVAGACPSGWTEHTAAQGRYIVGVPSGGTVAGTAGTALSNTENRPVGQHTHTQDAHNHTQDAHNHTQDAHNHTQDAHNHTQNSHNHTQDPHSHGMDAPDESAGDAVLEPGSGGTRHVPGWNSTHTARATATTTATNQNATATNQNATATNQNATATNQNATATNQNATATNQNAGSVAGTNAPYVQLTACRAL